MKTRKTKLQSAQIGMKASLRTPFGSSVRYRLNSRLSCSRTAAISSTESTPIRPLITLPFSVQRRSVRMTEGALRRACGQPGSDGVMGTPNFENRAGAPLVTNATMKSPGDSAAASTTQGRRLARDKSVNGNAARTISPGSGMAGEIGIVVAWLDVRVGIEVRLFLQEIQRAALLGQSGDVCCRQIVFPVGWVFQDQHCKMSIGGQRNVGRKSKPPPVFDFDWDCSHEAKIARKTRQPSLISGLRHSTLNSNPSQLS